MASIFRTPAARMLAMAGPLSVMKHVATPVFRPAMIARMNVAPRVGVAAFHTTKKMQIFPAGPQVIDVNTPAPIPDANPVHGSLREACANQTTWILPLVIRERIVSAALIPLTGSLHPITDAVLAATVVIHSHIGFQACIIDYFPKRTIAGLHRFMRWFLNGCTALVLLSLYEFETNDVGITEAIKRI
ncbi:succinate dehydrogenase membrane anchor subunit [Terfezia boudieri ATCC MYA-4762]|uniref:Succinate dehydrogenase [ubiquinone] cytochrome b small subunit n=1 Tax=Terfezia boudieri ATCC MYA-4762 TaxID=1051890 RepID=A0A3N4LJA1_9PEZI|nr:succinate dehydrogenase membrane anchor subunit [Terfezia boudieri ATCC MYA-4762]